VCLGFATYASHESERPMAIRWRLERITTNPAVR
jgi:hypothetical protein